MAPTTSLPTDTDLDQAPGEQSTPLPGDRRAWTLLADAGAQPTAATVHKWISGTITGPWGMGQHLAQRASATVSGLLAAAPRPVTVELRRRWEGGATHLELGVRVPIHPAEDGEA